MGWSRERGNLYNLDEFCSNVCIEESVGIRAYILGMLIKISMTYIFVLPLLEIIIIISLCVEEVLRVCCELF